MKTYGVVVAALVLAAASVAASFFTASVLERPQSKLERSIDEQVELAQRMLFEHQPVGVRLAGSLGTQPADDLGDKWQEYQQKLDDRDEPVGQLLQQQRSQLDRLDRRGARRPSGGAAETYQQLREELDDNIARIDKALAIVQKAIRTSEGSGEGEVRGDKHPGATRLEAVLLYHRADLLRRQAAVQRAKADDQRAEVTRTLTAWRERATRIHGLEIELNGRGGDPSQSPAQADRPTSKTKKAGGRANVVGKLIGRLFNKKARQKAKPQPELAEPKTPEEVAPVTEKSSTARPERIAPLSERIAKLTSHRSEVVSQIKAAEADADRLAAVIADLEQRISAAKAKAAEFEHQMMALEDAGTDSADPDSMGAFVRAYSTAAQGFRQASREGDTLEHGAIRNARPDAEDEDEMLTAPLVPAEANKPMVPERGLTAVKSDHRAAEAVVEASKKLLAEIDRQIAEITARQKELGSRIARLRESQTAQVERAGQFMAAVIDLVIQADALETEALELATGPGQQAAQRAKRAADEWIRKARDLDGDNSPDAPNQRLQLISGGRFVSGHAQVLAGDLAYVVATTQGQRAQDLERHQAMLEQAIEAGIQTDKLLPTGQTPQSVPAWTFRASAAGSVAAKCRNEAIQSAEQALEVYQQASDTLNQLWAIHTNIGAIHYLLANLSPEAETQRHLNKARQEYLRAIRDQSDRPEAEAYRRIIKGMSSSGP